MGNPIVDWHQVVAAYCSKHGCHLAEPLPEQPNNRTSVTIVRNSDGLERPIQIQSIRADRASNPFSSRAIGVSAGVDWQTIVAEFCAEHGCRLVGSLPGNPTQATRVTLKRISDGEHREVALVSLRRGYDPFFDARIDWQAVVDEFCAKHGCRADDPVPKSAVGDPKITLVRDSDGARCEMLLMSIRQGREPFTGRGARLDWQAIVDEFCTKRGYRLVGPLPDEPWQKTRVVIERTADSERRETILGSVRIGHDPFGSRGAWAPMSRLAVDRRRLLCRAQISPRRVIAGEVDAAHSRHA